MLQPDRLQPGIAPLKVKKMPNVQFKTAWKFPETGGKSRKKAEKTGNSAKNGKPGSVGKSTLPGVEVGEALTTASGGNLVRAEVKL